MPTADGNRATKDGSSPEIIRKTLEAAKTEAAAYFTTMDGLRTMIAVFDLKVVPDIVGMAEPLFTGINATVEFLPCKNAKEPKSGWSGL